MTHNRRRANRPVPLGPDDPRKEMSKIIPQTKISITHLCNSFKSGIFRWKKVSVVVFFRSWQSLE
jgi:hypothetical protein